MPHRFVVLFLWVAVVDGGRSGRDKQEAAAAGIAAGSEVVQRHGTAEDAARAAALAAVKFGGDSHIVVKAAYASATAAVLVNGGTAEQAGKAAVDGVLAAGGKSTDAQEAFLSAFRAARNAGLPRGGKF
jgi:hypothetical protein